jgi:hypoxanthine phosphoribosyltransferase
VAEIDLTVAGEREILTWDVFGRATREIATEIAEDGFRPDVVLAIARGGLTVAGALVRARGEELLRDERRVLHECRRTS